MDYIYNRVFCFFLRGATMPIYEYECQACEKIFEVQQRMTEDPLKTCPQCEGELKKLISASSFRLKGGGWYSDGYSSAANNSGSSEKTVDKKEKASPSPCKAGSESCKSCPAAA